MRTRASLLGIAALAMALALVGWESPASAHATFLGSLSEFPVSSQPSLAMNVPHEREDTFWNSEVIIAMPAGWQAVSCVEKPTWTCSIGTEDGRQVVHFRKAAGAPPSEDETFKFTVRTASSIGTFSFPTIQVYNDGFESAWIGEPGSEEPAPILKTVAAGTPTTTTPPTTNPHGTPTTTRPTATPTTTTPSNPGGPTGPTGPSGPSDPSSPFPTGTPGTLSPGSNTFETTTTLPAATTTTTAPGSTTTTDKDDDGKGGHDGKGDDEAEPDETPGDTGAQDGDAGVSLTGDAGSGEVAAGPSDDGAGSGGSALPIVFGVVVLGAAGAGGYLVYRRQSVAAPTPQGSDD